AAELDVRNRARNHRVGKWGHRMAVDLERARLRDQLRLPGGPAAELHLEPRSRQDQRHRGPHLAGTDDRGLAQWREPTEPLPLELDARPDARRDLGRKRRRRLLDAWEGERAAAAEADLHRADTPPAARVLGARDRDRHD